MCVCAVSFVFRFMMPFGLKTFFIVRRRQTEGGTGEEKGMAVSYWSQYTTVGGTAYCARA